MIVPFAHKKKHQTDIPGLVVFDFLCEITQKPLPYPQLQSSPASLTPSLPGNCMHQITPPFCLPFRAMWQLDSPATTVAIHLSILVALGRNNRVLNVAGLQREWADVGSKIYFQIPPSSTTDATANVFLFL